MPCGGAAYGDSNLVFIANDWHTALLPVYLQVSDTVNIESCPLGVHMLCHCGQLARCPPAQMLVPQKALWNVQCCSTGQRCQVGWSLMLLIVGHSVAAAAGQPSTMLPFS